jgi:hypothetical protein
MKKRLKPGLATVDIVAMKFLRLIIFLSLLGTLTMRAEQKVIVPAYFYPGALWDQSIAGAPVLSTMIMNPNSGPGTAPNADYTRVVNQARAAGVAVYGYVHTSYGARSQAAVLQDIDRYYSWYPVDGIFLDEVASSAASLPYYETLASAIRARAGQRIILNPGVYPDEGYMAVGDVLLTFESTFIKYQTSVAPSWVFNYSADRFYHIVYETSTAADMVQAVQWSRQRNAGSIFITDDVLDNPFDVLPTYWANELYELNNGGTPLNTAPTISAIADLQIVAGSTVSIPFTIADSEQGADQLQVTVASSNASVLPLSGMTLSGTGPNRFITLTPVGNGSALVTLTVSDGVLSRTESFTLAVARRKGKK